jgi:hypothetical protein
MLSAEIFLTKLDSNGNYKWGRSFTSSHYGSREVTAMALDRQANIVLAGTYMNTIDCDPGPGTHILPQLVVGGTSYFVTKLTRNGDFVWGASQGSYRHTAGASVTMALDTVGNVYTSGTFTDTSDFDPGTGHSNVFTESGNVMSDRDIFLSRINANGTFAWAKQFGSWGWDYQTALAVDRIGNVFVAGTIADSTDMDPDTGSYHIRVPFWRHGSDDAPFIVKLNQCPGPVSRTSAFACDSFAFGGMIYRFSGTYQKRYPTSGCDSISILDLTLMPEVSVKSTGKTLTAQTTVGTFQWVDCNNGMAIIPDSTGSSFSASKTGRYAVIHTFNGCSDTSACTTVIVSKVDDIPLANLTWYPNPTTGTITIEMDNSYNKLQIGITDVTGRLIKKRTAEHEAKIQVDIDGPQGLYFIRLTDEAGRQRILKLIKQ